MPVYCNDQNIVAVCLIALVFLIASPVLAAFQKMILSLLTCLVGECIFWLLIMPYMIYCARLIVP